MTPGARGRRPAAPALTTAGVGGLRAAAGRFGAPATAAKTERLAACARRALTRPRVLLEYHDALLFLLAYPGDPALHAAAARELRRCARAARSLTGTDAAAGRALAGSGIAGSQTRAPFSHEIARWLVRRLRDRVDIVAFDADPAVVAQTLALALPPIEAEITAAAGDDAFGLLDEIRGDGGLSRLAALLAVLARLQVPPPVRDFLYETAKPVLALSLAGGALTRTFARGPATPLHCHDAPLDKGVAALAPLLDDPLPAPRPLDRRARAALVDTARATLAVLARETDPVTWPARDGVVYHDLPRGAGIALFAMAPGRRFAIDSHTGFLLFKNAVPVAYGGGWPFLRAGKIGINVFPAFRGGESAWLFAQVLRTYRQHFGVARFVVEPYQFGAGNREGLVSGAFWFYYRLGFRPVDATAVAAAEHARLGRDPARRTPLATMRELARGDIALDVARTRAEERVEAATLSRAVSEWIASVHRGDRRAAQAAAVRQVSAALGVADTTRWRAAERAAYRSLCLLFALIPDLARWSPEERAACVALMRAKGADDDAPYFRQVQAHPRLGAALRAIERRTA